MNESEFEEALAAHTIAEMSNRMIALALRTHASPRAAAKALGIGRATIYRWIKKNGAAS